jgi:hypothetical protein
MHGPINVKSPNNISEWQMGFNSAFKELMECTCTVWNIYLTSVCEALWNYGREDILMLNAKSGFILVRNNTHFTNLVTKLFYMENHSYNERQSDALFLKFI